MIVLVLLLVIIILVLYFTKSRSNYVYSPDVLAQITKGQGIDLENIKSPNSPIRLRISDDSPPVSRFHVVNAYGQYPKSVSEEAEQAKLHHPTIDYQKGVSLGNHPAHYGDPIRPGNAAHIGPMTESGMSAYNTIPRRRAYVPAQPVGPVPGAPLNVPVPQGTLKITNESYKYPFYTTANGLKPYDYYKPYGPNQGNMQNGLEFAETSYNNPSGLGSVPFISSVSAFAPFPEVQTPWEKVGILTQGKQIMNMYRRPIAPLQDLFSYTAQDKNGFIIKLDNNLGLVEDGDTITGIDGKPGVWKANIYVGDKYVWV